MKKLLWALGLLFGLSTQAFTQIGWWTSSDTLNVFNKNKGSVLIGSYQPLGKLTVGPDDKFYNLSLVGDYNNLAKNYLQIGVTGRGFENLQGQTIFDLYHSNAQARNAGYNFRINGTSQFFINGEGNIGIGTEKPEAKLDLSGGPNWGGFTKALRIPGEHAIKFESNGSEYGMVATGGALNFVMSNQNQTTNPFGVPFSRIMSLQRNRVVIEGDIEVKGKIYSQGNVSDPVIDPIEVGTGGGPIDNGKGGGGILPTIAPPGSTAQDWVINGNSIYYTYNSGNVGIGTTSPAYKLSVSGNSFIANNNTTGGLQTPLYLGNMVDGVTPQYIFQTTDLGAQQLTIRSQRWQGGVVLTRAGSTGDRNLFSVFGTEGSGSNGTFYDNANNVTVLIAGSGSTYFNGGSVGIGTTNPGTDKLAVNGTIRAKELYLVTTGWSDFVFDQGYNLRSLRQVENYIKKNGRLPEIPSQKEVEEKGIGVIDMQSKLLQKIEELTLYLIEQNKKNEEQNKRIQFLEERLIDRK